MELSDGLRDSLDQDSINIIQAPQKGTIDLLRKLLIPSNTVNQSSHKPQMSLESCVPIPINAFKNTKDFQGTDAVLYLDSKLS